MESVNALLPLTPTDARYSQIPEHIRVNDKFLALATTYEYGLALTKDKARFEEEMRAMQQACAIRVDTEHHVRALHQLLEKHADLLTDQYKKCVICCALDVNPTTPDAFYQLCELRGGCRCSSDKAICPTCFTKQLKAVKWCVEGKPSVGFECPLCRHAIQYAVPVVKRARSARDTNDEDEDGRAHKTVVPLTLYNDSSIFEVLYSDDDDDSDSDIDIDIDIGSDSSSSDPVSVSNDDDNNYSADDAVTGNNLRQSEHIMFGDVLNAFIIDRADDYSHRILALHESSACPTTWPKWIQPNQMTTSQAKVLLGEKINRWTSHGVVPNYYRLHRYDEYDLPRELSRSITMVMDWMVATQPPTRFNVDFVLNKMRNNTSGIGPVDPIHVFIVEDGRNYEKIYINVLYKHIDERREAIIDRNKWMDDDLTRFFKLIHDKICMETIVDEELFKKLCQSSIPLSSTMRTRTALFRLTLDPSFKQHSPWMIDDMIGYQLANMPECVPIGNICKLREMISAFGWALYLAYLRECVFKFE